MSNTSDDDSHSTPHEQPLLGGCIPVSSKGDATAPTTKKRRSLPGNPDPDAEVVALSPRALLATNRYVCEVCHKGFQRDQNLQLHRRGHNLPWKLKQRSTTEVKKRVYVCPEVTCTHHDPSRALGDLTGIKKHFSRKHGEKKWKCDKCSKRYAVQSDWKAHAKICGTKEYRCDCGTIFSRKDSFVTHRAFCDALAEENYRSNHSVASMVGNMPSQGHEMFSHSMPSLNSMNADTMMNSSSSDQNMNNPLKPLSLNPFVPSSSGMLFNPNAPRNSSVQLGGSSSYMSATALLQKAAEMGARVSDDSISPILLRGFTGYSNTSRPSGSVPEPFNAPYGSPRSLKNLEETSQTCNVGLMSSDTDGSCVGNQNSYHMNSRWANNDVRPNTFQQGGLSIPPLPMRAENQNTMIGMERQMQRSSREEISEGRDARMTQDFLGLGPVGNTRISDPSYVESEVGLGYADGQQENQHGMYSYHHMEKPMWDF